MQTLKKPEISSKQFNPEILLSSIFTQGKDFQKGFRLEARYVYDYEIEYIIYSDGSVIHDGIEYPLQAGDIVFRRPGQHAQGIMPYTALIICFDLLGNTGKNPASYNFMKDQPFQNDYENTILDSFPPVFHSSYPEKYLKIFENVFNEYISSNEGSALIMKAYLLQLLHQLYMDVKNPLASREIPSNPYYMPIKNALKYMQENYRHKIDLNSIAKSVKLSPSHFHKIFSGIMNMTPNEYVARIRLEKAKELLAKTQLNIYEIALQCGFENTPYFNYLFRKQLNMSPGEFRKKMSYV